MEFPPIGLKIKMNLIILVLLLLLLFEDCCHYNQFMLLLFILLLYYNVSIGSFKSTFKKDSNNNK